MVVSVIVQPPISTKDTQFNRTNTLYIFDNQTYFMDIFNPPLFTLTETSTFTQSKIKRLVILGRKTESALFSLVSFSLFC